MAGATTTSALALWAAVAVLVGFSAADAVAVAESAGKDLRTKEQRLYDIKLRRARWDVDSQRLEMENKKNEYEVIQDLYEQKIETLDKLNKALRDYEQANLKYEEAAFKLERTRLDFLADATHISIVQAIKYRAPGGRRQVDITLKNASNITQAMSLNPGKSREEIAALLEIQNITVALESGGGLTVAEPYETEIPALKLGAERSLTFRLLQDRETVTVAMRLQDDELENIYIVLRRESLQDIPTINSVQFSQEGDLNTTVRYDLILERLAEDEKTFRLALVNLPREIDPAFLDPASGASLTQVKFSEVATRQQLELELQIPEKLSRRFVDETIEFYVFITDQEGFRQIADLNREYGNKTAPVEKIAEVKGNREMFQLIPRGKAMLECIVPNRYQEIKTDEEAVVRVDLLNTGTLEVELVHLTLLAPVGWTYTTKPDTIDRILPTEKEPVSITLVPPAGLGESEFDVRIEAMGYEGNERIEADERDITIRVKARASLVRNALVIGGVILLVVGVAVVSIKASRR